MRRARSIIALALGAALLLLAAAALAATGTLTYSGCFANKGKHDCSRPVHNSLGNNVGLAVSRDGASVYVATVTGSLTRFDRAAGGELTYRDCFTEDRGHGCGKPRHDSLDHAADVAVSPDGESVYVVAGEGTNAITRFNRNVVSGKLHDSDCIAVGGRFGCRKARRNSLEANQGVAVSPDGRSVYVASAGTNSITRFDRMPNGALKYRGCVANRGAHGCRKPQHDSLEGASDVVVSPDGRSVYVTALDGDSVSRFARAPTGAISFKGCVASRGANGCRRPAHNSLGGAEALAVSPDGTSVYVASLEGNAVSRFDRAASGVLEYAGCIADDGGHGCREPTHNSLHSADGVAVSPDGRSVYVTALTGASINGGPGSLTRFERAANGTLTYRGCWADEGQHDCTAPALDSLGSPASLAVSPDGTSVYVGSYGTELSTFHRELAAP